MKKLSKNRKEKISNIDFSKSYNPAEAIKMLKEKGHTIEINQQWVIEHAADRLQFICQGQSLNVFVPADVDIKELHDIHMLAWKRKLKTLYYCRSEAIKRAELVSQKIKREIIPDADCLACEA